jgi:hypothetical protein
MINTLNQSESASDFFAASADQLGYLASRWLDESQYEDINDYQKNLQTIGDKYGVIIVKMIKRPFGCEFTADGRRFRYTCTAKGVVSYRRVA